MRPTTNTRARLENSSRNVKEDGPNWVVIAGGALLSTLSFHIGYKLKQSLESKRPDNSELKGVANSGESRTDTLHSHLNVYNFGPEDENCFNCTSGAESAVGMKKSPNGQIILEPEGSLSLVTVPVQEYTNRENGVVWVSSPERIEPPPKPFHHHSNCSDSPCASDSGSDVFTKREVIQKLRQQLKRRDEMVLEMQDQIAELQNAVSTRIAHASHLQSQVDAANRELFESEREIQRLRKAIADHCVGNVVEFNYTSKYEGENRAIGRVNGYIDEGRRFLPHLENEIKGDSVKIDMLNRQIGELKEVIEGKDFLLQNYKEQKSELSIKIKELQHRLDSQLANIL